MDLLRRIRCASALIARVDSFGLKDRVGIHTGECERLNGNVRGLGVVIGARVGALAAAGEIFVSRTVRDLVVGSELRFRPRDTHELKGVPGTWELYAVEEGDRKRVHARKLIETRTQICRRCADGSAFLLTSALDRTTPRGHGGWSGLRGPH